eukprot:TRINITY_DN50180_c0_g1_i1.p2 TRINITY_DN50180_c0_g1~~TRINITY_DN50180_c0_g1_i1.p2  ORF type:complete len:350 (+),score=108.38 TRINITY_DN50180_c0_g1_i1:84-1133(+)
MALNLAASATPVEPFAAAGIAASGAGTGANPFAGGKGLVREDDVLGVSEGVPRDAFGEFISGDDDADEAAAAAAPPLTEEEEQWLQGQIAQDERRRGAGGKDRMEHFRVPLDELEDDMDHWLNAVEPEPGSAPMTPRSACAPHPDSHKRVIDLNDPEGRAYTKAEFEAYYRGTREWERCLRATAEGIIWEVVSAGGARWQSDPQRGSDVGDVAPCGARGPLRQVQLGFVCDAGCQKWLPLRDPSGQQLVALREVNPRRIAHDGKPYTQSEFEQHYGGLTEWEAAVPEGQQSAAAARYHAPQQVPAPAAGGGGGALSDKEQQLAELKKRLAELELQKAREQGAGDASAAR